MEKEVILRLREVHIHNGYRAQELPGLKAVLDHYLIYLLIQLQSILHNCMNVPPLLRQLLAQIRILYSSAFCTTLHMLYYMKLTYFPKISPMSSLL